MLKARAPDRSVFTRLNMSIEFDRRLNRSIEYNRRQQSIRGEQKHKPYCSTVQPISAFVGEKHLPFLEALESDLSDPAPRSGSLQRFNPSCRPSSEACVQSVVE